MISVGYLRGFSLLLLRMYQYFMGQDVEFTFPGTKWCGPGNSSSDINDLGIFNVTDQCCRNHDSCPEYIPANSSRYGLTNVDPYTREHCHCDRVFYTCLHGVDSFAGDRWAASVVGRFYFTLLEDRCFEEPLGQSDRPDTSCSNFENPIASMSPADHESQTTSQSKYVWKTMPDF